MVHVTIIKKILQLVIFQNLNVRFERFSLKFSEENYILKTTIISSTIIEY